MRVLDLICLGFLFVSSDSWHQLEAQEPAPRNQVTLDASILAGGLSYARMTSSDRLVGAGAGVGTEFNIRLVRGEKWGKTSAELAHLETFVRSRRPAVGSTTSASGPPLTSTPRPSTGSPGPRQTSAGSLAATSLRCGAGVRSESGLAFRRESTGPLTHRSESASRR